MSIAIVILVIITFLWAFVLFRQSHLEKKQAAYLFLAGGALFILLHGFLYSIGKTLSIDLFFFELRLIGKNGIADFEQEYLQFIGNLWKNYAILYSISSLIAPACIEEIGKLFTLIQAERKKPHLRNTSDAVFSMVFIAMGFAFLETILYLVTSYKTGASIEELTRLAVFRSVLSTISHMVFSGIVGFFYGRAIFAGFTIIDHGGITRFNKILKWVKKLRYIPISSIKTLYKTKLMVTGFWSAILLHIAYNYSLFHNNIPVAYLLVAGSGCVFFWYTKQLEIKECNYQEIDDRILYLAKLKNANRVKKILTFWLHEK